MKERLEQEVAEYNTLIDQLTEARERLTQLDAERERRLGRIQLLNELVSDGDEEQDKAKSSKK